MTTLAFDIEANGPREVKLGKDHSVTPEVTEVHCICIRDVLSGEEWSFTSHQGSLEAGWRKLMSADILVAHNGIDYDMPVLRRLVAPSGHDLANEPKIVDTIVWSRFLYPDRKNHPNSKFYQFPNALKAWGIRLGVHKGDFDGPWDKLTKTMLDYCVQDVRVLVAIYLYQLPLMTKWKVLSKLEHAIATIINRQSCNGVSFDEEAGEKFERQLISDRAEVYDKLQRVFTPTIEMMKRPVYYYLPDGRAWKLKGDCPPKLKPDLLDGPIQFKVISFNPNSDDQAAERLVEKYGWKPEAFTEGGKPSVTEDVLSRLPFPEAAMLNQYKMIDKRLTSLDDWQKRAEASRDGRIHGSVISNGTPTARMTHSQPNQTQVTKVYSNDDGPMTGYEGRYGLESRSLFGPRKGWVQVGADASGLELRMLANRTFIYDGGAYAKIIINEDVHTYNMQMIPLLQTRPQSKVTFYAGIYGAGFKKQGTTIMNDKSLSAKQRKMYAGMTVMEVGREFKKQLKKGIPALGKATDRCKMLCKQQGYLNLLDGRQAPIRSDYLALNTQLQGDGSVLCKLALFLSEQKLRQVHGRPWMEDADGLWEWMINAHDEMQLECHPDIADSCGEIMAWSYSEAGRRLKCLIETPGEYKVGANWAETH